MKKISTLCFILLLASCATNNEISYNKTLDSFSYPFQTSEFNFNSQKQNLQMTYMDIGHKRTDKVIVLLHGKNFSGYYFERLARDILKKGYRIIIPDQIGFGKSSKPENYQYNFSQLALNTRLLLESLNIKKSIITGHSMGGMLATTYAYNYPLNISKLILINPIGLEPYGKYAEYKDTNFFYKIELAKTVERIRNYQKKFYYDGKWTPEYELLLTPHKGQLNGDDWHKIAWHNALTYSPIFAEDITSKFSSIKAPTSLIIGTRDRTGPGRGWKKSNTNYKFGQYQNLGKVAQKAFPNAALYEMKGIGHMPHFEAYAKFIDIFKKLL
jgi:pimeloyl-ACP methyl ester carboxylesterase